MLVFQGAEFLRGFGHFVDLGFVVLGLTHAKAGNLNYSQMASPCGIRDI